MVKRRLRTGLRGWHSLGLALAMALTWTVAACASLSNSTSGPAEATAQSSETRQAGGHDQMDQAARLVSEIGAQVEDYQYEGLFLGPTDAPASNLVRLPVDKTREQVKELARLGRGCSEKMNPDATGYSACTSSMNELQSTAFALLHGATVMRDSNGYGYLYIERDRAERLLARAAQLIETCRQSMAPWDAACARFQLASGVHAPAASFEW